MIGRLRQRLRAWFEARIAPTDTVTLTQRNVYILPTRAGWMFALVLVVMLLSSINYQLNLGYVLTFLLAGAGFVSMHLTHNTLRGMTLHLKPPQPGFAGEALAIEIVLASPKRELYGVGVGFEHAANRDADVFVDVAAGGQSVARLALVPARRGLHPVPTLHVETRYPLGLFRAWTVWRPAAKALAWPAPEKPAAPLPAAPVRAGESAVRRASDGGEFDGVRTYRRGDALKRIVWKKVAKLDSGGDLITRDHAASVPRELWLDWQHTQASGTEPRLARLAAWVLAADAAGMAHGLRLPGVEIPPGSGGAHRRASLDALALWA
ncbi:MAG TPA: DUF58 domain-containing protein [Burkholderiaceae bacterium]|nr:DUF58 domain-containing protein [Burkholderiaceae bacterium]